MGKKKFGKIPLTCDVKKEDNLPTTTTSLDKGQKGPVSVAATTKGSSGESMVEVEVETSLEKLMSRVNDETSLRNFVAVWNKEVEGRKKLRECNANTIHEEVEKLIAQKKLDSNLKKCTGFVRKLRQYQEGVKSQIESEIKVLNLSKYLSEIAQSLTEAKFKVDNISDAVYICSLIHQRYADFAPLLMESYKKILPTKKTEMSAIVVSKVSVDIRMIGELILSAVLPRDEGSSILLTLLKNMIASDREGMQCVLPVMSFVVGLGDAFLGVVPKKIGKLVLEYGMELDHHELVPEGIKKLFKAAVSDYFSCVCGALVKFHNEKQKSELYNRKLMRTKGEIPPDRKEAHAGTVAKYEKYNVTAMKFADAFDADLPELLELPADPEEEEERALLRSESGEIMDNVPGIVIFEDEETRAFYQDFKDLKVYLPPVAYRESIQQSAEETQKIEEREKALNDFDDVEETAEFQMEEEGVEEEPTAESEAELPPSLQNEGEDKDGDVPIKPSFKEFLDRLPNCGSKSNIDKAALEFAENFNTKPNRKKLVQTLFRVPRQRIDLLPHYGRLVAILNPVMPDVGLEMCRLLKNDFFFLVKKKHQVFIESKLKIVRFIGELVNFRIFPKSDALQCLKVLLMNFVHHQIDMACVFVETCGRLLYRTPDSHRRMKIYLEEMLRKKTVKRLESRYVCMVDHAYSIVCPPEAAPKVQRKLTPIELYLKAVLVEDLCKDTYEDALETLQMLDWDDDWAAGIACCCLTCPWEITAPQMSLQARLLVDLLKYEPEVVTNCVDIVLEEIRIGLDNPAVLNNSRRFMNVAYLCELYYYRLVSTEAIFDALYFLLTHGVSWTHKAHTLVDTPDNLSRVRLAAHLLTECGEFLGHGANKKRLRVLLLHCQKYFWFKRSHPFFEKRGFPYGVYEAFEEIARQLWPKITLAKSYEEACKILEDVEEEPNENGEISQGKLPKLDPLPLVSGLIPYMDPIEQEMLERRGRRRGAAGDMIYEDDEDGDPYERGGQKRRLSPEEEEFETAFQQLCSEVNYTNQPKTEIVIPLHITTSPKTKLAQSQGGEADGTVTFTLMTKRGNKPQFKKLDLPVDSEFVTRMRQRQEEERAERESVKKRTLAISAMQAEEEEQQQLESIKNSLLTSAGRRYRK